MQSRHLCSFHVWHAGPGQSRSTSTKSGSNPSNLVRHVDRRSRPIRLPLRIYREPMAMWIRSRNCPTREIGRNAQEKWTCPHAASRLGTPRSRGLRVRCFFPCKRSHWRDEASLLDIEWQFSLGKKGIVAGNVETSFTGKSYLRTRFPTVSYIFISSDISRNFSKSRRT